MGDVSRRAYSAADAAALADLMNAIDTHAGGRPRYTGDMLDGLIRALVADPATDSIVVRDGDGSDLVAAAFATTPPAGGFRVYLTGGVRPDRRGQGLGRELLAWQVDRIRAIHAARQASIAWQAEARTLQGDLDAARLFRRLGLKPTRYWFEMIAGTANPPQVPVPDGLRIAAYDAGQYDAVYQAHHEAFAQNWAFQGRDAASWSRLTVGAADFAPELSLVAFDGSVLVGYLLAYWRTGPTQAHVGQLGVLPAWRRRGLAAALLARVLAGARESGRDTVALNVDAASITGAVAVYERLGFTVESTTVTHSLAIG